MKLPPRLPMAPLVLGIGVVLVAACAANQEERRGGPATGVAPESRPLIAPIEERRASEGATLAAPAPMQAGVAQSRENRVEARDRSTRADVSPGAAKAVMDLRAPSFVPACCFGPEWPRLYVLCDSCRSANQLDLGGDAEVVAAVLATEQTGQAQIVFPAFPQRSASRTGLLDEGLHVPVFHELFILREFRELMDVHRHDAAVAVLGAQTPDPAGGIPDQQVAELVLADDLGRVETGPVPGLADFFDEAHVAGFQGCSRRGIIYTTCGGFAARHCFRDRK